VTGEIVESRPTGGVLAGVFLVAAVGLAALFATAPKKSNWPIAFLPVGVAAGIWLGRDRLVRFRVGEQALEFERPTADIVHYQYLTAVTTPVDKGTEYPIQLTHAAGQTLIPARLTVPSRELHEFLESKLPPEEVDDVPAAITPFRDEQIAKFGRERVFTYLGRPKMLQPRSYRGVGGMLGLLVAAVLMGLLGTLIHGDRDGVWLNAAIGLGFFGGFTALILYLVGGPKAEDGSRPALVVSPVGIALVQGDTKGKLRWDEVKGIEHPPVKRMGTARTGNSRYGVGILVAGAYIVIKDQYHRPAREIYDVLCEFWNDGRPG
jgi:hypothetical protein